MKKIRKVEIFLFLIILLSILIFITNYQKLNDIVTKQKAEDTIKDITFQVYSNENDILKILVTAEDTENGIDKIVYTSEQNQENEIYGQGKTKVSLDYVVNENGSYTFKAINGLGEEIIKTLTVDDNYRNGLIDINVTTETSIATNGTVTIDYHGNEDKKRMYKIGENGTWTNYTGEFTIDSYEVIKNNLQNDENKQVSVYAKIEDDAKNIVEIYKVATNIDVDMADEPQINILSVDEYPTLTSSGMENNSVVSVKYDNRSDVTNYYSIDNGQTWLQYTDNLSLKCATIMVKSVKNESGLEVLKKEFINASASDALGAKAYDNDYTTMIYAGTYWDYHISTNNYFNVSRDMWNKNINFIGQANWNYYGPWCHIYFLNEDGTELSSYSYRGAINLNENLLCPENCVKVKIILNRSEGVPFNLSEIRVINE